MLNDQFIQRVEQLTRPHPSMASTWPYVRARCNGPKAGGMIPRRQIPAWDVERCGWRQLPGRGSTRPMHRDLPLRRVVRFSAAASPAGIDRTPGATCVAGASASGKYRRGRLRTGPAGGVGEFGCDARVAGKLAFRPDKLAGEFFACFSRLNC